MDQLKLRGQGCDVRVPRIFYLRFLLLSIVLSFKVAYGILCHDRAEILEPIRNILSSLSTRLQSIQLFCQKLAASRLRLPVNDEELRAVNWVRAFAQDNLEKGQFPAISTKVLSRQGHLLEADFAGTEE